MKTVAVLIAFLLTTSLFALSQKKAIITRLITYKVNLRLSENTTPKAFADTESVFYEMNSNWYGNKLSPEKCDELVRDIHKAAGTGKIKVYNPLFDLQGNKPQFIPYPFNEVAKIGNDTLQKTLSKPYPPYNEFDTLIVSSLNMATISQIEFMEQWTINTKTLEMRKKIIAYALWRERFDVQTSEFRGMSRMYWVKLKK